jgi:hypothetical protein
MIKIDINNIKTAERSIETARKYIKIDPAKLAVDSILTDLCGRKGLSSEFSKIDDDVKKGIIDVWEHIMRICYDE